MSAVPRFVGQRVERREDPRLLTGHGAFVDDVVVPGMVHAAFVRSELARARVIRVDTARAAEAEGVVAVLTAADLDPVVAGEMVPTMFLGGVLGPNAPVRPLAATDVRFVGEPIAIVVATDRYLAEDAAELVEVELEPLTPVVDFEQAAASTTLVHPELGTNVASRLAVADPALPAALAGAVSITQTFTQGRQSQVPLETRGIVARWQPFDEQLDIWVSGQMPHEIRLMCARIVGVPEHHVRVIQRDVGGGFGQKSFLNRDEMAVVLAARRLGIALKWIEDRRENLIASNHARLDRVTVTLGCDAEGILVGGQLDHLEDSGAFPNGGTGGAGFLVAALFPGPYRLPHLSWEVASVWTNTCGRGAYRGPWMVESLAREQAMDVLARAAGIDPLELRRRNVVSRSELPVTTCTGMTYDHVSPAETLEQAAELIDYDGFRLEQAAALAEGRLLGIGIGLYLEPSAQAFGALGVEAATVRVEPTGKVTVLLGTGAHGQGIETTMMQLVADELGVPIDDVVVHQGDTATAPFGGGTGGSRTAVVAGGASREAAGRVREKIVAIAAHLLEAAPEDVELVEGQAFVRGTPARQLELGEIAMTAYTNPGALPAGTEPGLEAVARFATPPITWSNACHMCTCEVDPGTGQVRLLRFVVSEDCGVMINPMVVEGQIAGGVVQGIGGVLYEQLVYDADGNPLTTTFLDYLIPTATEVPLLEYGHIETPSGQPGGYKGMGEGGAIGSVPAVFNAVADALAQVGVTATRQPLGPSTVLALLADARWPGATASA